MTRTMAREQAFILVFEKNFSEYDIDEILLLAKETRDFSEDDDGYVVDAFTGVFNNIDTIDELISNNLSGWTIGRISKVSLAVLRLAIYEMKFMSDIPVAVSIDEAVELCKKYSTVDDSAFVNGVLGTVAKGL